MTVISKSALKKDEKHILPLVHPRPETNNAPTAPAEDGPNSTASKIVLLRRGRQLKSSTTAILLLVALLGFSIGTIGGLFYYRQYAMARERMRYHGFCKIPYDAGNIDSLYRTMNADRDMQIMRELNLFQLPKALQQDANGDDSSQSTENGNENDGGNMGDDFFREEFELGLSEDDSYSKIDVPLFRGQRPARFLHDFTFNQSGIIDSAARRCFIMPLDRDTVLPPQSLRDLIQKMQRGYYNIDTSVLKKTMRVVLPEMTDFTDVSPRITKECLNMKIYQLEKIISGVYKRSTDIQERAKFAEFGGQHISLIDIQNIDELEAN